MESLVLRIPSQAHNVVDDDDACEEVGKRVVDSRRLDVERSMDLNSCIRHRTLDEMVRSPL